MALCHQLSSDAAADHAARDSRFGALSPFLKGSTALARDVGDGEWKGRLSLGLWGATVRPPGGLGQPALARTRQGCGGFDAGHALVGGCWPSAGSCAGRFLDGAGMLAVLHSSIKVRQIVLPTRNDDVNG